MALQSSFYIPDGSTKTFPSTKHIATKQHVAVYFQSIATGAWSIVSVEEYSLISQSIVFDNAPDATIYQKIEIRVADTYNELEDSPSDIAIVASISDDIIAVNANKANIDIVAANINSVNATSANQSNINTVSGSIANVNAVGLSIANVNAVATDLANINAVQADLANIDTVATNIANVNATGGSIANVNTVSGSIANVNATAVSIANVNTVATSIANVNTTASSIAGVNTVATNISNINAVVSDIIPNLAEILLADDNAVIATQQATLAEGYAASINPATLVHKDSDTGAAYIPSGTTAQRPSTPENGYMRYNTDLGTAEIYSNGMWGAVGGGATGGGADKVFIENEYTITTSYTIPAGKSAVSVGDSQGNIYFNAGTQVDFSVGSRWVIL